MFNLSQTQITNLKVIVSKLKAGDDKWFKDHNILVNNKSAYWILNYLQTADAHAHKPFTSLTRGLVVKKNEHSTRIQDHIASFPFVRFFNKGEPSADPLNISNSHMIEKMDGTMVGTFLDTDVHPDFQWHTRKMISSDPNDMSLTLKSFKGDNYKLLPLIGTYVKNLNLAPFKDFTLVFEFIHDASQVLTSYNEQDYGLYLISGRNLNTFEEFNENELDSVAKEIGCARPKYFDAIDDNKYIQERMNEMLSLHENFEGFVFRDKTTGVRLKVKDPEYVRKHSIIGSMSFKGLLPSYFQEEQAEITSYLPETKKTFKEIDSTINAFLKSTNKTINKYHNLNLPTKELAFKLFKSPNSVEPFVKSIIMEYSEKDLPKDLNSVIYDKLKVLAIGDPTNNTQPKIRKLCELLKQDKASPDQSITID